MLNKPKLSVILANYNYEQFIGEALDALLTQSYENTEVIVTDDGSTDNSVAIIKEFLNKYPNLRFFQNEKNMGGVYTANRCLKEATGDYLYSAASDDIVLPGFFEKSMAVLMKYPQAGLCFSELQVMDIINARHTDKKYYLSDTPRYFSPFQLMRTIKREPYTHIFGPTVIVKRSALLEMGGYNPELLWSCDAFAHHVIGFRYGACYVPEIMTIQRIHEKQMSAGNKEKKQERKVIKKIFDLLLSPAYADVLPMFKAASPISPYPWDVLMEALRNKQTRSFISIKLLKNAIYDKFIRRAVIRFIPKPLARNIINMSRKIKYHIRKLSGADRAGI